MKNESVKKSLEKSKNVLEKYKNGQAKKNCIKKTNTFTIIAMNFVQEQFKKRPRTNTIQFLWIVKKRQRTNRTALQKRKATKNSLREADGGF